MAVSFNQSLGGWQINGRGFYGSEEAARAAEASQTSQSAVNDDDFAASFTQPTGGAAPVGVAPVRTATRPKVSGYQGPRDVTGGASYDPAAQARASASGNVGGAAGAYNAGNDTTRAAFDATHRVNQGGVDMGKVGDFALDAGKFALDPIGGTVRAGLGVAGVDSRLGYLGQMATGPAGAIVGAGGLIADARARGKAATAAPAAPAAGTGTTAAGGSYLDFDPRQRNTAAARDTRDAESQFQEEQGANAEENDSLFSGAMDRYDALGGGDYLASDQARQYQQEGLQQQRMLLEKMLGFDEEQYADTFADKALARTIAAGRQGTSAAEQQVGRFAAMEQAPALYAEGRRQASELANQRLGLAESAAKSFGELGTMTRGQDETRAQFDAQLPLEIANSVSALTQGKMNLNQQESQMFGEIWMDFARLQSVYAGMSSQEQMAWWQNEAQRRGQDKQLEAIMANIKANGAVTDKDLINGLFQLGGGLLGLGGRMGAA